MSSRMERYNIDTNNVSSRNEQNQNKYKEINMNNVEEGVYDINDNVSIINNNEELNKLVNNTSKQNIQDYTNNDEEITKEEETIYDINEYLKKAGENKKKYVNNDLENYDVLDELVNIDIPVENYTKYHENDELSNTSKEIINTQVLSPIKINNHPQEDITYDLFADLKASNDTVVIPPLKEEEILPPIKEENESVLVKILNDQPIETKEETKETTSKENTFYDNSLSFSKKDFDVKEKKGNKKIIYILITLIGLIIVGVLTFIILESLGIKLT